MTADHEDSLEQYREPLQRLQQALDAGDEEAFSNTLDDLTRLRERELFSEIGKLTRELHEALKGFRLDFRLAEITENEMPDAQRRLEYVIEMTSEAAHRTLHLIEELLPGTEELGSRAASLRGDWQRFLERDMDVTEFRRVARRIDEFLAYAEGQADTGRSKLNELLMAQEYQDITGQTLRRVIALVEELQDGLVEMLRVAGGQRLKSEATSAVKEDDARRESGSRPSGPSMPDEDGSKVVHGQDDVDDLLSDLGF